VINDFLDFIAGKMRTVEPWKGLFVEHDAERAEAEFDLAMEAMEKLVMNRLWHLCVSCVSFPTPSLTRRRPEPSLLLSTSPQSPAKCHLPATLNVIKF
jgi:hypothetical protein